MAKVTEYPSATATEREDFLYIVQDGVSKKIPLATLLGGLPDTLMRVGGLLALDGTPQLLTNTGTASAATVLTTVSVDSGTAVINIANGTTAGQMKVIAHVLGALPVTLVGANIPRDITIAAGGSLILFWIPNKWYVLGGFDIS